MLNKFIFLFILLFPSIGITQKLGMDFSINTNITTLNYDRSSNAGWGSGGGIAFALELGDKFTIRPEINYQMRRFKSKSLEKWLGTDSESSYSRLYVEKFHFIDIPLILLYKPQSQFGFLFGVQYGKGLVYSQKYKLEYSSLNYSTGELYESNEEGNEKEPMDEFGEISLLAGFSYHFNKGMTIEFRGQRSLCILDGSETNTDLSWSVFQLGIRYELRKR